MKTIIAIAVLAVTLYTTDAAAITDAAKPKSRRTTGQQDPAHTPFTRPSWTRPGDRVRRGKGMSSKGMSMGKSGMNNPFGSKSNSKAAQALAEADSCNEELCFEYEDCTAEFGDALVFPWLDVECCDDFDGCLACAGCKIERINTCFTQCFSMNSMGDGPDASFMSCAAVYGADAVCCDNDTNCLDCCLDGEYEDFPEIVSP
jgi:hypothetical protein